MRELISKEYMHTNCLMNPQRKYINSASTDISVTIQRKKEAMALQQKTAKQQKIRSLR